MIKTIIFDMGMVVIKNNWEKISKNVEKKYHITTQISSSGNKKAIKEYEKTNTGKSSFKKVLELLGAEKKDIPKIIKAYKIEYKKHKVINKKLLELIKKLKGHYKIICLTDTNKLHHEANNEIGLFKDFDKIFASHIQKIRKENPRTFKKLLKQLKIEPQETLFIDDNEKNIKNAKSIGINVILYKKFPRITKLKREIQKFLK